MLLIKLLLLLKHELYLVDLLDLLKFLVCTLIKLLLITLNVYVMSSLV